MKNIYLLLISILIPSLAFGQQVQSLQPIDSAATSETQALLSNLHKLQVENKTIFGQQDATLYGRTWSGDKDRSDVKDLVGDHPGMVGLDFEKITNLDKYYRQQMITTLQDAVKDAYSQGGIITFAWHTPNPANDGSFYWEQNPIQVVSDILPGGSLHEKYKGFLQSIATVSSGFVGNNGELIPIIFRPFHEFDGEWFWWGKTRCTKDEFVTLWKFTVDYLRNDLGVHNFLYAFSPDCRFNTLTEYLDYYPGDDYVDILGMDNYWDFRPDGANDPSLAKKKLQVVVDAAAEHNKIAALTETGLEGVTDTTWYTSTLLPILRDVRVAYVAVWRNANDIGNHYYTPTKGHPAAEDFKIFCKQDDILLQKDLPSMYIQK